MLNKASVAEEKSKSNVGRGAGGSAGSRWGLHQGYLQVGRAIISDIFDFGKQIMHRFRPLNDTEERTGSKVIVKFPSGSDDQCVSISGKVYMFDKVWQSRKGKNMSVMFWFQGPETQRDSEPSLWRHC